MLLSADCLKSDLGVTDVSEAEFSDFIMLGFECSLLTPPVGPRFDCNSQQKHIKQKYRKPKSLKEYGFIHKP